MLGSSGGRDALFGPQSGSYMAMYILCSFTAIESLGELAQPV